MYFSKLLELIVNTMEQSKTKGQRNIIQIKFLHVIQRSQQVKVLLLSQVQLNFCHSLSNNRTKAALSFSDTKISNIILLS